MPGKPHEPTPYEELAGYMSKHHPNVSWYISRAGFVVDEIASLRWEESGGHIFYRGLVICPKPDGTRLRKRDGNWSNTRIALQAARLGELADKGYIAQF